MIVLHIAPLNMTTTNGFRFSVPGIVHAQNALENIQSALMTVRDSNLISRQELSRYDFDLFDYKQKINELPPPFHTPDLAVFHGIYLHHYIGLSAQLRQMKIPYVIVPRVSLTLGAQSTRRMKKAIGNTLFFNKFIYGSNRIQYLTENERNESSRFTHKNFIVGNGINLPEKISTAKTQDALTITYLGRYNIQHKGLDLLMEAIASIKEPLDKQNVRINLYGSDSESGKERLKQMVVSQKLDHLVSINPPVFDEEKKAILEASDIFIAPSRYEGHPMAVIEAMAYGIPCILTKGTNMMDEMIRYDAGWPSATNAAALAQTILTSISDDAIHQKRLNARRLAEERCTWRQIANQTIREYEMILSSLSKGEPN